MVGPERRRKAVSRLQDRFGASERGHAPWSGSTAHPSATAEPWFLTRSTCVEFPSDFVGGRSTSGASVQIHLKCLTGLCGGAPGCAVTRTRDPSCIRRANRSAYQRIGCSAGDRSRDSRR